MSDFTITRSPKTNIYKSKYLISNASQISFLVDQNEALS